ncbi:MULTISPECIES: MBL fold metallo-hydrolase [Microbacterium]|uniref:MBL fold metallo-hydrolase n=1 Tax=Microbacterium TaxID=33882 RepID=UPI0006F3C748|nr:MULTISPECIES: MBL fold metallo-hydrolase [unclassified Microbacterium]MBN9197137.1 MBL fold metallo-hydrolase [Microbacterium ginsengisoli]MCK9916870.1 MBL fold metallo-hydrolase [Microbacteriaceae bacterium K1510]KQR91200.1 MBL fold metallo-hydrolase [Microbacterium sp. Leaf347]ODU76289.1 MAG: MBL fold metallo-hydrolase [Microbacterium sp. SCN 71-21]OJU77086.1 MAG: MBL fold metallo-hydrolase [Microbacterium sp. 71-23]
MRVTKHLHAALTVENEGKTLVVDPGSFTTPLEGLRHVVAIVVTHEHPDHWTPEHLTRLRRDHGDVPIYAPTGVAAAAAGFDITVVEAGDTVDAGGFTLRFFGGRHNEIHSSIPIVDNLGVLVDDRLYYPGDSYAVPKGVDVELLAAPVGAPWLKIGDAMDFVLAVAPRHAFATHDMTLSVAGRDMGRARLRWATEQHGGAFHDLDPEQSVEI